MYRIDLNCDMGESFGAYEMGQDVALIPYMTSVNIACGFHAGDPATIRSTVKLALEHGTAIGAHPGLPDLAGFGRRKMQISPQEAYDMTVYQIGAVRAFADAEGGALRHVKPHGALYNMAAVDRQLADAIAEAVYRVNPELLLFGLAGSELLGAGAAIGLRTVSEAFADRSYEADGTLTPRGAEGAVIADPAAAAAQAIEMITRGAVRTRQGTELSLKADSLCLHSDTPGAASHARLLREKLEQAGIEVRRAAYC